MAKNPRCKEFGNQQYQKNPDYDAQRCGNPSVICESPNPSIQKQRIILRYVGLQLVWRSGLPFCYHDSSTLHHSCVPNSFGRNFGGEHAPILKTPQSANILYI